MIMLCMIHCCIYCQSFPDLRFNHLTNRDGLSSNSVSCVIEDKQGFIWIGTDNGLNRYEGYRMKQYFHDDADSSSLVFNSIHGMYCDRKGRLWITTGGGLSCFLPEKNSFINYTSKSAAPMRLRYNGSVVITESKDGSVWLSSQGKYLFKVQDDMTLKEVTINVPPFMLGDFVQEGYYSLFVDHNQTEWAWCANRIYLLDPATKQPARTFDLHDKLLNAVVRSIYEDSNGMFWLTTWGSTLWCFDPVKGSLVSDKPLVIADITEWTYNGRKWMAAIDANKGLYLLDGKTAAQKKFDWNADDAYSIDGSIFYTVFADHRNNLWICTNKGVNYVETTKNVFDIFPVTEPGLNNYHRETNFIVYSYLEDDKDVWVSKRYLSTMLYDDSLRLKKFYGLLYPLSTKLETNWRVSPYYFFKRGTDVFITTDSALIVYDEQHETTSIHTPTTSGRLEEFRTIVPLNNTEILIRSLSDGLFFFNTTTKKFTRHFAYPDSSAGYVPPRLNYLFKSATGDMFIAGDEGNSLTKYSPAADHFERVLPVNENDYHLFSTRVFGMEEDNQRRLWMATSNGIFVYNPKENRIDAHYTENGKMGILFRVCRDNYNNIWTNGSSGIWCFVAAKNKWISFNEQDGLPGNDYEGLLTLKKNGDIAVGLSGAIAFFHPGKLNTVSSELPAVITEASIDEKQVSFSLVQGQPKQLLLSPGQHSFSVDFTIKSFFHAAAMQYYYKLEPLMKDFRANSNGHINFNGLAAGHYTLHVKAEGKAGNIHATEDTLEIDIQPYWYLSWWFKTLAVVFLAWLILFLIRKRIAVIRNESALKQKIVETEMQALRAQMNPHFIFNSLSSIENFIMQNEKRLASDYLNKFARLIRMILDSSRNELVSLSKDMDAIQLYVDLEQISNNNKFVYQAVIDPDLLSEDFRVPPLLIQPYVENAIVHGLAHSREKDLVLSVTAQLESDYIKYIIEDNGIGREQALQYKLKNKPNHKSVGLKITEERVAIFNRQTNSNGAVIMTDLYNQEGKPRGTRVEITIKAM